MRTRFQSALVVLTGASSMVALALHGYLGTYSRYLADDFCSAGMARRLGVLRAVWYWYLSWTGRYSASALDAAFGLLGPAVTPLVTVLVLLVWLAALAYAATGLLARVGAGRRGAGIAIASIIVYVSLTLSPNVPQSLYWGQGMRSVVPPLILTALLVAHVAKVPPSPSIWQGTSHQLAGSFLLAFLIGGFNETMAALQLGGLVIACILSRAMPGWQTRQSTTRLLVAGMLGAAVSIVMVALSPGNAVRQAFYPAPPDLPKLLDMAWANFISFLNASVQAPQQRLAVFGALALAAFMGYQSRQQSQGVRAAVIILAAGFSLAFAAFVPAAYALSDAPPERTMLLPAHLLTLTLILEGFILGGLLRPAAVHPRMAHVATAVVLSAAVMLGSAAALTAERLLSSRLTFRQYAEHWDAMDSEIRSASERGEEEIWIQPIRNWAGLNEPNDNPKFWLNECLREYYGIRVLGLDIP